MHSRVYRVLLDSYQELHKSHPQVTFVYGETGAREGGRFRPHITHRNGLSVDLMVPVLNGKGKTALLPAGFWNSFGYAPDFDSEGKYRDYRIDFETVAEHLYQLHHAAKKEGIGIRLVIFAPELTKFLEKSPRWPYLSKNIRFYPRARVRHDDHYHIDFAVPCSSLGNKPRASNALHDGSSLRSAEHG